MQHRAIAPVAPLVLDLAGLAVPRALHAQAATAPPRAVQLEFLSRERAAFLDAATVKRTFAALGGRVPGSN